MDYVMRSYKRIFIIPHHQSIECENPDRYHSHPLQRAQPPAKPREQTNSFHITTTTTTMHLLFFVSINST